MRPDSRQLYNNDNDLKERIIEKLKEVYDPEIPVNIYDLGLIYEIDTTEDQTANIKMTLSTPGCPEADSIMDEIEDQITALAGIKKVEIDLVWDPPWNKDMMSEEAKLELDLL